MTSSNPVVSFDDLFPEIVQSIFLHAYYEDRKHSVKAILLVSRLWKAIALATPDLWTLISISSTSGMPAERNLERVAEWITRSADATVDIEIRRLNPETETNEHQWSFERVDRLASILTPTSPRWRSLQLVETTSLLISSFFGALLDSGAPRLQVLEMDTEIVPARDLKRYTLGESSAPNLSILLCPNVPFLLPFINSLAGLTALELGRESFDVTSNVAATELTETLNALPKLEHFAVRGKGSRTTLVAPYPDLSHPNGNTTLTIYESIVGFYIDDLELLEFFIRIVQFPYARHASKISSTSLPWFQMWDGTLRLPRLEMLHVDGAEDTTWNHRGLESLPRIYRSQYWLTSLTFEKIHFRDDTRFKSLKGQCRLLQKIRILDCFMWSPIPLQEFVADRAKIGRLPLLYFEVQRLRVHELRAVADVRGWLRTHVQLLRWY